MSADLFIFGCSHAGRLLRGAQILGLEAAGGGMMRGRLWDEGRFDLSDEAGLVLHDEQAVRRLASSLASVGAANLAELDMPIVTTLGFQADILLERLARGYTLSNARLSPGDPRQFLPREVFEDHIRERRAKMIGVIAWLVRHGRQVIVVTPPPRFPVVELAVAFEAVVIDEILKTGAKVHDTRDWAADAAGLLRSTYVAPRDDDRVHGNGLFGARAMAQAATAVGIDASRFNLAAIDSEEAYETRALSLKRLARQD